MVDYFQIPDDFEQITDCLHDQAYLVFAVDTTLEGADHRLSSVRLRLW